MQNTEQPTVGSLLAEFLICGVYLKVMPDSDKTRLQIQEAVQNLTIFKKNILIEEQDTCILALQKSLPNDKADLKKTFPILEKLIRQPILTSEQKADLSEFTQALQSKLDEIAPDWRLPSPKPLLIIKPKQQNKCFIAKEKIFAAALGAVLVVSVVAFIGVATGGIGAAFLGLAAAIKLASGGVAAGIAVSGGLGVGVGLVTQGLFCCVKNKTTNPKQPGLASLAMT